MSVLVTTCDRAEYLRLCLTGYLRQSEGAFEVIVSDDGSTDGSREVVEAFAETAPFPVRYLWQERDGHRRARAINMAIAAARHDWLLFTDCDSVPHRDLVAAHRRAADPRRLLCGARVKLRRAPSDVVTLESVLAGAVDQHLTPAVQRSLRRQHWRNCFWILIRKKRRPHNYGLNMSCSKRAMAEINGYDHNFRGWGNADGDVRDRLRMTGVQPRSVVHRAIVFHLYHDPHPTRDARPNEAYARRPDVPARCADGLAALAGEPYYVAPEETV